MVLLRFCFCWLFVCFAITDVVDATGAYLTHSLVKIRPFESVSGKDSVSLSACRNEYESMQVILVGQLDDANVSMEIPWPCSKNICHVIYRVEYLNITDVSGCQGNVGMWPDALIPHMDVFYNESRRGFPIHVPQNENRVVWIDVFIPPETMPGVYEGKVSVRSSSLSKPVKLSYTVTVWSATLPSKSSFVTSFGFNSTAALLAHNQSNNATAKVALTRLYLESALMNRITLGNFLDSDIAINSRNRIHWQTIKSNWQQFFFSTDLPFGLQGAAVTSISVPTPFCWNFSNVNPACDKKEQVSFWKEVSNYFDNESMSPLLYDYTFDEPKNEDAWNNICDRVHNLRKANSTLKSLVTTEINKARRHNVSALIDILVPIINYVDPKPGCNNTQNNTQCNSYDTCKYLWWYQSCMSHGCEREPDCNDGNGCSKDWPSYMIDRSAISNRVMSWLSYLYEMQGELYWGTNYIDEIGDAWKDQFHYEGNGDGTLFYPGYPTKIGGNHSIPIESIRMKQIRDGLEDLEMFRLLETQNGSRQAVLDLIKDVVHSTFSFTDNPDVMLKARQTVGNKLQDHSHENICTFMYMKSLSLP
ncbi:uncharacterized protein LOC134178077 [Corticium candelabrum]|uniref:uncharacterized protein LOC134178077 n=1 Tax=Corticium candelabrum TaxID=121492 RepID=UPI002E272A51|nr:uncharacterized protein LOC134178077 [Corticium candelabrum]